MANGARFNPLRDSPVARTRSLAIGVGAPQAATRGFIGAQRAQQEAAKTEIILTDADAAIKERELNQIGAAISGTTDEAGFDAAVADLERRKGVQPGTFSARFKFKDREAILREVEGAKSILLAQRKKSTLGGFGTAGQAGSFRQLVASGVPEREARLMAAGVKADELEFVPSNRLTTRPSVRGTPTAPTQPVAAIPSPAAGAPTAPVPTAATTTTGTPRGAIGRREFQKTRAKKEATFAAERPENFRRSRRAVSEIEATDRVLTRTVAEIKKIIKGSTTGTATGLLAPLMSKLGPTAAAQVQGKLKTLLANIGFDKLQAMREASPTGGALGQVSENENRLLQSVSGNLDPDLGEEVFLKALDDVLATKKQATERRRDALREDFDDLFDESETSEQATARRERQRIGPAPTDGGRPFGTGAQGVAGFQKREGFKTPTTQAAQILRRAMQADAGQADQAIAFFNSEFGENAAEEILGIQ